MNGRILVGCIGNIFLGDDGFGVEVARRLAGRELPEYVEVADFGIRGLDLVYALQEDYGAVILVDALPRGGEPGTVYLIEPEIEAEGEVELDTHSMDPVKAIRFARAMGAEPVRTLVVGCEPGVVLEGESYEDVLVELSQPVQAAVEEAVELVESLVEQIDATNVERECQAGRSKGKGGEPA